MLCLTADLVFNSKEYVQEDFAWLLKIFELQFYILNSCFFCLQNLNSLERKSRVNICNLKWSYFLEKYCFWSSFSGRGAILPKTFSIGMKMFKELTINNYYSLLLLCF